VSLPSHSSRPNSTSTMPGLRSRTRLDGAVEVNGKSMIEADAAARLISETAHDLRSPLTTVRESIRLVRDGSFGDLRPEQQVYLDAAIDQCNCIDQLVSELVQFERLRSGLPRVHRRWVSVQEIRKAVDETLRPWALPREISILWDGADDSKQLVFADPLMLRRLLVNLATNSIRVSAEGKPVLIRLQPSKYGESLLWSVIDQGTGIAAADMHRIAERQISLGSGEGLGISISRQLAALHFSALEIRSRVGVGTQVNFRTAASGPQGVAEVWSHWRVSQRNPRQKPLHRDVTAASHLENASPGKRVVRLDPPSVAIELGTEHIHPRCVDRCAAGTVTLGAAMARQAADAFDELFQNQLQVFELAYRVNLRQWIWVLDVDQRDVRERLNAISDIAQAAIPSLRLHWSGPQMIPIDERRTINRVRDLLIRQTLAASMPTHAADTNQVRLGTSPLEASEVAVERLEAELRRLNARMKSQSQQLRAQMNKLRPVQQ